uniref:SRCR domain-containing protein n=1 Tax=Neogobius melanostomus TaxID=47308 RepID=A0A8C6TV12_9GOBI
MEQIANSEKYLKRKTMQCPFEQSTEKCHMYHGLACPLSDPDWCEHFDMSFCIIPDSDDVRLVGGASHCEGELQVKHLNRWREVYIPDFLLLTAADSVRLLHGSSQCSGSLEVKMNQSWTLVCEEDFDLKDAEVVCRELGCGDPSLLQGTFYGEGFAPVRQMFQCEGHESALMDCPRSSVIQNNCTSFKAVVLSCLGIVLKQFYLMLHFLCFVVSISCFVLNQTVLSLYVVCAEPLRLTGGSEACAGTLELRHRAQWRPVFVTYEPKEVAAKACHLLDCGTPLSAKFTYSLLDRPIWSLSPTCMKMPSLFRDCLYIGEITETTALEVKCSGNP